MCPKGYMYAFTNCDPQHNLGYENNPEVQGRGINNKGVQLTTKDDKNHATPRYLDRTGGYHVH